MPVAAPFIASLQLTDFKSFRDVTVPLSDLTILIGRNSSGKSNVLDALEVLSRLASPQSLTDALDSRASVSGPVWGGSTGCAPHSMDSWCVGAMVRGDAYDYRHQITIEVRPVLRVVAEKLVRTPRHGQKK